MSDTRTFQDRDFRVWEVFATSGRHGFSDHAAIVFNCLTERDTRPRSLTLNGDAADVQKTLETSTPQELLALLERASEIT
jgi:hypothetical protein